MSKKWFIGDAINKARKSKKLYVGGVDNKAHKGKKIYIGDTNGKARLCWSGAISVLIHPDRNKKINYSLDLVNWTVGGSPLGVYASLGCTFGNDKFMVAAPYNSSSLVYSADGINWTLASATFDNATGFDFVDGKFIVMIGQSGQSSGIYWESADCVNWVSKTYSYYINYTFTGYPHRLVKLNGTYFMIGHYYNGDNMRGFIFSSTDRISFTCRSDISRVNFKDITYGNGIYAAACTGDSAHGVYRSTNGTYWTAPADGKGMQAGSGDVAAVRFGNGVFVAAAYNGLWYSTDCQTWTQAINLYNTAWIQYLVFANGRFFAGSNSNGISYYSYDGKTWTQMNNPSTANMYGLAYSIDGGGK